MNNYYLFLVWGSLSFDWQAALFVGGIVVVGTAVVLVLAIAAGYIAIPSATLLTIGGISLLVGAIAGMAAGLYRGNRDEIRRKEEIEKVVNLSGQLDIYFDPAKDDPNRAAEFRCNLVWYEPTDLSTTPTVTTKRTRIAARAAEDFYKQVDHELKKWFMKAIPTGGRNTPRRVTIYMRPFPGEGIYEKLKILAEQNAAGTPCIVNRSEAQWSPPFPSNKPPGE